MTDPVEATRRILTAIDFPFATLKRAWADRTPKVVLGLGRVVPGAALATATGWGDPGATIIGSRRLIDFLNLHWAEKIGSGSYDEIRRSCVRFLVEAGVAVKDPDDPGRAPNSPVTGYALSPEFARLFRSYGRGDWDEELARFGDRHRSLRLTLRAERDRLAVPVTLPDGTPLVLSPGRHNALQAAIVSDFLPRFVARPAVIYIADALDRLLYRNAALMAETGLFDLDHRLLPDVIVLDRERGWLLIIEAVATAGHISPIRKVELTRLLKGCRFPPVFVSAFPDRATYRRFADDIAWETEVWIADHPTHMIHFNGDRFLGPH